MKTIFSTLLCALALTSFGACAAETVGDEEFVMENVEALTTGRTIYECAKCPETPENAPEGYTCKLTDETCNEAGRVCGYKCTKNPPPTRTAFRSFAY